METTGIGRKLILAILCVGAPRTALELAREIGIPTTVQALRGLGGGTTAREAIRQVRAAESRLDEILADMAYEGLIVGSHYGHSRARRWRLATEKECRRALETAELDQRKESALDALIALGYEDCEEGFGGVLFSLDDVEWLLAGRLPRRGPCQACGGSGLLPEEDDPDDPYVVATDGALRCRTCNFPAPTHHAECSDRHPCPKCRGEG
jgi:hypothetical protein